jgi:prolyl 4-hydroxylase
MTIDATLERQAATGDVQAQLALARDFETRGQNLPARGWYARAAQRGDPAALRGLAANLLSRHPLAIEDGIRFMRSAAELGDAEALHVCAVLAAQDANLANNWDTAFDFLLQAAERGSVLAQQELALFAAQAGDGQNWKALRDGIDIANWLGIPAPRTISESPHLAALDGFATPGFCDWLIMRAQGRVQRARVYDPATGEAAVEDHRTNGSANFDFVQWDLPIILVRMRIARAVGLPVHCLEFPTVLHYVPGQEFEPHFDFLDPEGMGTRREIAVKGQRMATCLIYLNDEYEGAETEFLELGIHHRGRKGDALLFWNVDASGAPDFRTKHAGRAPLSGQKWLFSQWIREEKPSLPRALAVHQG